ncbi:MAG: protein kinase [Thermoanaerobaculia bacterium]|jgi:serine/threonine protein kinase
MIGRTVGHYRVIERLGGGGMGVVYKAEDLTLGRFVALKFLSPEMTRDADAKQRFLREARAASLLDHPNICTVYEVAEDGEDRLFIAMGYYEGETLKALFGRGALPVCEGLRIGTQLLRGLARAHAQGIVHRDIKPANVIVTTDGVVKILDFGLAKLAGEAHITKSKTTLGTLAYMAPEQLLGDGVGPPTDLWAAGVVLFEALTGERPFRGEYAQSIAYSIINEQPSSLLELRPDAPVALERIIRKMLRKDPLQRYQSADELLVEFDPLRTPSSGPTRSLPGPARPRESLRAGARLGPYEIVEPIGSGGMGDVYRARDTRLDRQVAIKVLAPEFSEDAERKQRFQREAKTISSLSHPSICTLFDVGEQEGTDYLVMEYLEGETLADRLTKGALPLADLLRIGIQIGEALGRAHQHGIVHRDLKPGNVMLTKAGAVKLVDFGLAKDIGAVPSAPRRPSTPDEPLTAEGAIVGTLAYMAPEQVEGREADARSDIFAFGAILYEMATGRRAFEGATKASLIVAILEKDPALLSETRGANESSSREVRSLVAIEHVVRQCLEKDPEQRWQSALDVGNELRWLSSRSSSNEPLRMAEAVTLSRWRRRWVLRSLLGLAFGIAIASSAVITYRLTPRAEPAYRKVTFGNGAIGSARFTADGNSILYGAQWEDRSSELFASRLDSSVATALGLKGASVVGMRGGDAAVLLARGDRSTVFGAVSSGKTLATIPVGGGEPRAVVDDVEAADWDTEGEFAIVRRETGRSILEYPVGRILFKTAGGIGSPKVSPDRKYVAFAHYGVTGDIQGAVVVVDTKGNALTLSDGWMAVSSVRWSPDGDEVWFSAGRYWGWYSIYAVDLDRELRLVLSAPSSLLLQDVLKDGRVLISSGTITNELWGKPPGDKEECSFSWLDGSGAFGVSSNGKVILFCEVSVGGGPTRGTYIRRVDGGTPVRLGEGRARGLSPDGSLALSNVQSPRPLLQLIPTGAGSTRTLPTGTIVRYHWASFFPDGRRILIVGNEASRPRRLFVQKVSGGDPRPISPEGVWVPEPSSCVSPDGLQVAAIAEGRAVLVPVGGGAPTPIAGLSSGEYPIAWTSDGQSLFVAESSLGHGTLRITLFEVEQQRRSVWREIKVSDPTGAGIVYMPLIAADGDAYYYTVFRQRSNIYLAERLR